LIHFYKRCKKSSNGMCSTIEGFIVHRSFTFPLAHGARIFFYAVSSGNEDTAVNPNDKCRNQNENNNLQYILVPSKNRQQLSLTSWLDVNCRVQFTGLKTTCLFNRTNRQMWCYQVGKRSEFQLVDESLYNDDLPALKTADEHLVSYKGVVTKLSRPDCGVYTIDKKLFLILTGVHSAIGGAELELGDSVCLFNFHLVNYQHKKTLVACGRSFLYVEDDISRLQSAESPLKMSHPFVDLVAEHSLSINQLLLLYQNYQSVSSAFSEKLIVRRLMHNSLQEKKREDSCDIKPVSKRSMAQEFLQHPTCCSFQTGESNFTVNRLLTVADLNWDTITSSVHSSCPTDPTTNDQLPSDHEIIADIDAKVIGILNCKEDKLLLEDNSGRQLVLVSCQPRAQLNRLHGKLVEIEDFVMCREKGVDYLILPYDVGELKINEPTRSCTSSVSQMEDDLNISRLSLSESGCELEEDVEQLQILGKSRLLYWKESAFFLASVINLGSVAKDRMLVRIKNIALYNQFQVNIKLITNPHPFKLITASLPSDLILQLDRDFGVKDIFEMNEEEKISIQSCLPLEMPSSFDTLLSELSSCLENEIVTTSGLITERSWMKGRIDSSSRSYSATTSEASTMVITLTNSPGSHLSVQVYVKIGFIRHLPLGLIPGTWWRFSCMKKVTSKKDHIYLVSTVMSDWSFIAAEFGNQHFRQRQYDQESAHFSSCSAADQIGTIRRLLTGDSSHIARLVVSVQSVLTIKLKVECSACCSGVYGGSCSYVGCYAPFTPVYSGSCCVEVEDGTGCVDLLMTDINQIFALLNLSESKQAQVYRSLNSTGELSYSRWKHQHSDPVLVDIVRDALGTFYLVQTQVRRYMTEGRHKLYCLHVQPQSAVQLNASIELALQRVEACG